MYTQCPECLSVFSLDAQTLARAHGHVVCGHCEAGFDSLATLAEQLPPEPFVELPINEPSLHPPQLDLVVYRPRAEATAVIVETFGPAPKQGSEDFSQLVFAPRFAREPRARKADDDHRPERRRRPRSTDERRWPWVVACTVLTLLLGVQLAWAETRHADPRPAGRRMVAQQLRRTALRASAGLRAAAAAFARQQCAGASERRQCTDDQRQRPQRCALSRNRIPC